MINNLKIKNLYYLNKISLIFIITYSNELNIFYSKFYYFTFILRLQITN